MLWLGVLYLGSLAALFITSLWTTGPFGTGVQRIWNLDNYRDLFTVDVYRTITFRTLLTAVAVTVIDALLAFPIALYMAKVASPRMQKILVVLAITPLWASYLVKAYAWRGMFSSSGPVAWLAHPTVLVRWHDASETHRFKTGTEDIDEQERLLRALHDSDTMRFGPSVRRSANRRLARAFLNRAYEAARSNDPDLSRACVARSFRLGPGTFAKGLLDPRLVWRLVKAACS